MQKQVNKIITRIIGKKIRPEKVLLEIGRALFYFGLGITITGLYLLNRIWLLGFIFTITGFVSEIHYSNVLRDKKRRKK